MKKLLPILLALALCESCNEANINTRITIHAKYWTEVHGGVLPNGICEFRLSDRNIIQDSCSKYSVGDTIKFLNK